VWAETGETPLLMAINYNDEEVGRNHRTPFVLLWRVFMGRQEVLEGEREGGGFHQQSSTKSTQTAWVELRGLAMQDSADSNAPAWVRHPYSWPSAIMMRRCEGALHTRAYIRIHSYMLDLALLAKHESFACSDEAQEVHVTPCTLGYAKECSS
jgi:hypothetical protein